MLEEIKKIVKNFLKSIFEKKEATNINNGVSINNKVVGSNNTNNFNIGNVKIKNDSKGKINER